MPSNLALVRHIYITTKWFFYLFLLLIPPLYSAAAQQVEQQPQNSDVRVLIDVSGSMKKNDPNNLRLPALRLLVGLLPPGSTAAVWNFGTQATPLVAAGLTDETWKENARKASKLIHSRDLFTNIGAALEAAIADWGKTPSKLHQRSIILLTDGMIDISKDDNQNKRERQRILSELLPEIEKTGASIHTIALSANADHDFLKQLSTRTDGGFEQTENAEQLERIFLRLFEKTTRRDTVPLVNNSFMVDESILELTLLVFKPKNARPTSIIEPNQKQYQMNNRPNYVKWQAENNYDLITIANPKTGEWSIKAETDPDNRVMVVTNLQVQTNRIPNNLFAGETLNISLFMTEQNKKIADDSFLQFVSMSAIQTEPTRKRWFLHDNGLQGDKVAHDGIYNVDVRETLETGKNHFTFRASSDTFQREINHSVMIHDTQLINTRVDQVQKHDKNYHQIFVTPNLEFISARNVVISAQLIEDDISQPIKLVQANPNLLEWSYESNQLNPDKNYQIVINMQSKTRSGRPIDYTSEPIPLTLPKFDDLLLSPEQLIKDEDEAEAIQDAPAAQETVPVEPVTDDSDSGWMMGIIIALIANILLGLGGWFGYRKWQQNRESVYEDITGELE